MKPSILALGIASGLAMAVPVSAQQANAPAGGTESMGAQGQRPAAAKGDQAKEGHRAVVGQVIDTRTLQVKGPDGKSAQHRLVKLQNRQKEVIVVDLGVAQRAPTPKKGETFVAMGKAARINGRPVLLASFAGDLQPTGALMASRSGAAPRADRN